MQCLAQARVLSYILHTAILADLALTLPFQSPLTSVACTIPTTTASIPTALGAVAY